MDRTRILYGPAPKVLIDKNVERIREVCELLNRLCAGADPKMTIAQAVTIAAALGVIASACREALTNESPDRMADMLIRTMRPRIDDAG